MRQPDHRRADGPARHDDVPLPATAGPDDGEDRWVVGVAWNESQRLALAALSEPPEREPEPEPEP